MDRHTINRSSWDSGRGWVPAAPAGFWVAMHRKGGGQRMGHAVHGHMALLHNLQQRRLGLRGSTVDLVRQKQVAVGGALPVLELIGLPVEHGEAGDVRGQRVRGELDSLAAQTQGRGEGQSQGGLAHTGAILQQHMAAGVDGHQHLLHDLVFADKCLVDLRNDLLGLFYDHPS